MSALVRLGLTFALGCARAALGLRAAGERICSLPREPEAVPVSSQCSTSSLRGRRWRCRKVQQRERRSRCTTGMHEAIFNTTVSSSAGGRASAGCRGRPNRVAHLVSMEQSSSAPCDPVQVAEAQQAAQEAKERVQEQSAKAAQVRRQAEEAESEAGPLLRQAEQTEQQVRARLALCCTAPPISRLTRTQGSAPLILI